MSKKIIQYLKKFRSKFKKVYNTLRTSNPEALSTLVPKIFRKLGTRKVGGPGANFLQLLEQIILPHFWLKLGKNVIYQLQDYFYFVLFLVSFRTTPESGSLMLQIAAILGPNADTFLYHLAKFTPEEIEAIMAKINAATFHRARRYFRRGFFKRAFPVAIDYTDQPFYGDKATLGVVGGKPKAGTAWFYSFAALTIIQKHVRFTLAVKPVLPLEDPVDIVHWLVQKAEEVIHIKYIEVDRGFFGKTVINFFIRHGYRFLMPVTKNKRVKAKILAYHTGKIGPAFRYQFRSPHSEGPHEEFTVFLTKAKEPKPNARKKRKKKRTIFDLYQGFATNPLKRHPSQQQIKRMADRYRERWGVETGFKMEKCFQIKTASKNFGIRLFCFLFSVVMYNLWILFNLLYQSGDESRYILPVSQVKMLLLAKALGILTARQGQTGLELAGGDSP